MRERDPLALRREVSLVPQLPALIDGTVHDNVAYGPRLAGHSFDARSCLELAGLDPAFEDRDASKLSVGEQQRVMLARALALEPRVLLLDEPTSALDQAARDAVEGTLRRLRARTAISLVVVTHDIEQARRLADYVVRIESGRVIAQGPATELLARALGRRRSLPRRTPRDPSRRRARARSTSRSARSPRRSPWSRSRRSPRAPGTPDSRRTSGSRWSARSSS